MQIGLGDHESPLFTIPLHPSRPSLCSQVERLSFIFSPCLPLLLFPSILRRIIQPLILWQSPLKKVFYDFFVYLLILDIIVIIVYTEGSHRDDSTQTESVSTTCTGTQSSQAQRCTAKWFNHDPEGLHFYTGLENYEKFVFVLSTLCPAAYELKYYHGVVPSLPVEDQFFVTLIKLRRKKTNFEFSRMFAISQATVTNIFVTWINFMTVQWGEIDWWPSRDLVSYFAPIDFQLKFPTTRVVVDGTECPIQKPKQPIAQQATFSTYKNKN